VSAENTAPGAVENKLPEARVHLLAADGLLTDQYLPRHYFTLCGELLTGADLPHATCESGDCGCEVIYYCEKCLHYAAGWNAEIDSWSAQVR
jgi:hypothetical protein